MISSTPANATAPVFSPPLKPPRLFRSVVSDVLSCDIVVHSLSSSAAQVADARPPGRTIVSKGSATCAPHPTGVSPGTGPRSAGLVVRQHRCGTLRDHRHVGAHGQAPDAVCP